MQGSERRRLTSPERRAIIERLIEEKRRNQLAASGVARTGSEQQLVATTHDTSVTSAGVMASAPALSAAHSQTQVMMGTQEHGVTGEHTGATDELSSARTASTAVRYTQPLVGTLLASQQTATTTATATAQQTSSAMMMNGGGATAAAAATAAAGMLSRAPANDDAPMTTSSYARMYQQQQQQQQQQPQQQQQQQHVTESSWYAAQQNAHGQHAAGTPGTPAHWDADATEYRLSASRYAAQQQQQQQHQQQQQYYQQQQHQQQYDYHASVSPSAAAYAYSGGTNYSAVTGHNLSGSGYRDVMPKYMLPRGDARSERVAIELQDQWENECTFQPNLRSSSRSHRGSAAAGTVAGSTFYERNLKWNESRMADRDKRRQEEEEKVVEPCTFRPEITRVAQRVIAQRPQSATVVERLYAVRKPQSEEEIARQREEEELRACTFRPKTNSGRGRSPNPVHSRYMEATLTRVRPATAAAAGGVNASMQSGASTARMASRASGTEPSFTPKTNPVRRDMPAAQRYLAESAHERLARAKSISSADKSNGDDQQRGGRSTSAPRDRRAFSSFLQRQNEREEARKRALQAAAQQATESATHQPQLARRSVEIMNTRPEFLARLEERNRVRENRERAKATSASEEHVQATFHPEILPRARAMPARSVDDLSMGDLRRRELLRRGYQQQREQQEQRELTFRPNINPTAASGALRVHVDPDGYMDKERERMEQKQLAAARVAAEREQRELDECTFRPEVHDAPVYVRRIARSIQMARGPRVPEPPQRQWL